MKKTLIAAVLAFLAIGCSPKAQISGQFEGTEALAFSFATDMGTGLEVMKEVDVKGGKFAFDVAEESGDLIIYDPNDFMHFIRLYFVPDQQIVLTGTYKDYKISGSQFYKDMGEFKEICSDLDARYTEALDAMIKADEENTHPIISFDKVKAEVEIEKDDRALDYIKAHPDSDFSAYLASQIRTSLFDRAETSLTERARNGMMIRLIDKKHVSIHGAQIAEAAKEYIKEGVEAPDFTLKTLEGEDWTLSDHRGGYVLLDFWGTWCHFCVEGMPTLKKVVEAYPQLTVASIDCYDSEIEWKKGLEEIGIMTWTQLYNPREFALDAQYAVGGFPGFFIIDPDGNIKKIIEGEGGDFVGEVGSCLQ